MDAGVTFNIEEEDLRELSIQEIAELSVEIESTMNHVKELIEQCDEILSA
jgi:hypothetical protein